MPLENLGRDVADVPLIAIAREAGMSRSTLVRRLNGSRQPLDDAVRAAGVEPGGRPPVRERAVQGAAALISDRGLAAVTLEAVAAQADCSVHSLYAVFGGRDELLRNVFDRYGPILELDEAISDPHADLAETVHRIYRLLAEAFSREPRVAPAMLAEGLARPTSPAAQALLQYHVPRMLAGVGQWLAGEITAGRIRRSAAAVAHPTDARADRRAHHDSAGRRQHPRSSCPSWIRRAWCSPMRSCAQLRISRRRRSGARTPPGSSATLRGRPATPIPFGSTTENPTPATC